MKRIGLNRKIFCILLSVAALCLVPTSLHCIRAKASVVLPSYIQAFYMGDSELVGSQINRENIWVQAVYEDGSVEDVSNYAMSTERVLREGDNEIAVVYMGKRTSFFITGKRVTELSAYYVGEPVSVGNYVSKKNISLFAMYSDGSGDEVTDYTIGAPMISRVGTNTVHLIYAGKATVIEVPGRAPGTVNSLQVAYYGNDVMLGSKINRDDIYVTALYTDGSSEIIENYEMSMQTPEMIGANTVIVNYRGLTSSFIVTGYEKGIEKLSASYTGSGVEVGKDVRMSDIKVTATYTDGSVEAVSDFTVLTPTIYYVGAHTKTVHYMGLTADIYVIGIEAMKTSYDNATTFTVSNGIQEAVCRIAVPAGVDNSLITGASLRKASVSQVVPRAIRRSDFIAFEITAEPDGEDELPLEMKITVPQGFDPEDCVLYFTPNRKTIIARMNTFVNDDGELELTVYKTGTFLLAYEPEPEEESEK